MVDQRAYKELYMLYAKSECSTLLEDLKKIKGDEARGYYHEGSIYQSLL